jgi:hypothetical protein
VKAGVLDAIGTSIPLCSSETGVTRVHIKPQLRWGKRLKDNKATTTKVAGEKWKASFMLLSEGRLLLLLVVVPCHTVWNNGNDKDWSGLEGRLSSSQFCEMLETGHRPASWPPCDFVHALYPERPHSVIRHLTAMGIEDDGQGPRHAGLCVVSLAPMLVSHGVCCGPSRATKRIVVWESRSPRSRV